jgi:hypothetical protein
MCCFTVEDLYEAWGFRRVHQDVQRKQIHQNLGCHALNEAHAGLKKVEILQNLGDFKPIDME